MSTEQKNNVEKLVKMIKEMDFGMLTTTEADGSLRSRPMATNGQVEDNGDIWFFTYGESNKVLEAQDHPEVNVSFSDIKNQKYVSLSGTAQLVRDQAKIIELWQPELKAWFPQGVETPDIALLRINAEKAEYWDTPSSFVAHTLAFVKSVTGSDIKVGENKKLALL
jgi:general stress protein 26